MQAVEKQLKGFIIESKHKVRKIHNLDKLLDQATNINNSFSAIEDECLLLNKYLPGVKYSNDKIITKNDLTNIIQSLSVINNFPPLKSLRDSISKKYKYEIITEISAQDQSKTPHSQNVIDHNKKKKDPEPDRG
jgi:hypothetical protein